jgi:hypothetical protein
MSSEQYSFSGATSIGGYTKGATSVTIPVANAQFSVGNLIRFDQTDDTSFIMSVNGPGRNLGFISRITAVSTDGRTLTFSPPLPFDLKVNQSPEVAYLFTGPGIFCWYTCYLGQKCRDHDAR